MLTRKWYLLAAALFSVGSARAELKPHELFTDNMVIQRDREAPVWGTATAGSEVVVSLGGAAQTTTKATAGQDGKWMVKLPAAKAEKNLELKIEGDGKKIAFKNVALGDVYICSGQSNMEWRLSQLGKDDQGKKVAAEANNDNIRLFHVAIKTSYVPLNNLPPATKSDHTWLPCTPENVINFSAVAYFFGREIAKSQNVTVGLISTNWGGTICEAWASREGLQAIPSLNYFIDKVNVLAKKDPAELDKAHEKALADWKIAADKAKADGKQAPREPQHPKNNPNQPTVLYNGMIQPLLPFAIKGAIWYQGESNAGRAQEYRTLFPQMITDWRQKWGYDFPFFVVQLAPYQDNGSEKVNYAELRDAQWYATQKLKDVGIAVITDVGDEKDIHPQKKGPVGERLAIAARAIAYGEKIEFSGPVYSEQKIEGDKVILSFTHLGGGLEAKGETLNGFTLCGEDKVFQPAKATIVGTNVVLTSDKVAKPVAARCRRSDVIAFVSFVANGPFHSPRRSSPNRIRCKGAAADGAFHRGGPAGIGPIAGEEQTGNRRPLTWSHCIDSRHGA
jgi:sialate O-acetylesterase